MFEAWNVAKGRKVQGGRILSQGTVYTTHPRVLLLKYATVIQMSTLMHDLGPSYNLFSVCVCAFVQVETWPDKKTPSYSTRDCFPEKRHTSALSFCCAVCRCCTFNNHWIKTLHLTQLPTSLFFPRSTFFIQLFTPGNFSTWIPTTEPGYQELNSYNALYRTTKGKSLFPVCECDSNFWPVHAVSVCFVSHSTTDTGDMPNTALRGYTKH